MFFFSNYVTCQGNCSFYALEKSAELVREVSAEITLFSQAAAYAKNQFESDPSNERQQQVSESESESGKGFLFSSLKNAHYFYFLIFSSPSFPTLLPPLAHFIRLFLYYSHVDSPSGYLYSLTYFPSLVWTVLSLFRFLTLFPSSTFTSSFLSLPISFSSLFSAISHRSEMKRIVFEFHLHVEYFWYISDFEHFPRLEAHHFSWLKYQMTYKVWV